MFADPRVGAAQPQPAILNGQPLTPEDVEHAPWWHYTAALERDVLERGQWPTKADVENALKQPLADAQARQVDIKDELAVFMVSLDYLVKKDHRQSRVGARKA